jgi:hypothetical protein
MKSMNNLRNEDASSHPRGVSPPDMLLIAAVVLFGLMAMYVAFQYGWEAFKTDLRAALGPPLKRLYQPLDRLFDSLPMWVAQASAIGLFVAAAIFAWCLPRRYVYLGAPDQARWRDLRIWATLVLVPYMLIYWILGR